MEVVFPSRRAGFLQSLRDLNTYLSLTVRLVKHIDSLIDFGGFQ